MITRIRRNPSVERDILGASLWVGKDSDDVALRFLAQVEASITGLQFMPGKGSPKHIRGEGLADVRTWYVPGFPNFIIVYDLRPDELYVLAVLDGRRRYIALIRRRAKG